MTMRLTDKQFLAYQARRWDEAQLQRTGKQIAEGAVQAMERDLVKLKGGDRHVTGEISGNAVAGAAHPTKRGMNEGEKNAKVGDGYPAGSIPEPTKRGMNGLETAYAQHLELRKLAGEVLWWKFEGIRLRLADGAYYKPDFCVLGYKRVIGGEIPALEFHETKGHMREAANVRLKVAADLYPFKFFLVSATDRRLLNWTLTEVR